MKDEGRRNDPLQTQSLLLSIDVGTSRIKVSVFTEKGQRVALGSVANRTISTQPLHAEQDPEAWWASTVNLIRRLRPRHKCHTISAIAVTGQMHTPVLVGAKGKSLCRAQIWLDRRAQKETEEIAKRIPEKVFYRITGYRLSPYLTAPKLLWTIRNDIKRYLKTRRILLPKDYIRSKFTSDSCTDWTDANGTGLFDIRKKRWSDEVLGELKLDIDKMPDARPPHEVVGYVTEEAARLTGLKRGTPVVTGAGDDVFQLGTGAERKEMAVNLGTSCSTFVMTPKPVFDPKLRLECFMGFGCWLLSGTTSSAGASVDWALNNLAGYSSSRNIYSRMDSLIGHHRFPSGIIFLPYLNGERTPIWDPEATGAFHGLTLRHKRGDLIKAVLEGVGFTIRSILELTEDLVGRIHLMRIAGGATSSPSWTQILADSTNRQIVIPSEPEATLLGAAMLAAVGSGHVRSIQEARELQGVRAHIYPDRQSLRPYAKSYDAFESVSKLYLKQSYSH